MGKDSVCRPPVAEQCVLARRQPHKGYHLQGATSPHKRWSLRQCFNVANSSSNFSSKAPRIATVFIGFDRTVDR
eukprot:706974-Pyramimonas_sp.AAC.1